MYCLSMHVHLGGSGGMSPRKNLKLGPCEVAIFAQIYVKLKHETTAYISILLQTLMHTP